MKTTRKPATELEALAKIVKLLEPQPKPAQERICNYVYNRFVTFQDEDEPEPETVAGLAVGLRKAAGD